MPQLHGPVIPAPSGAIRVDTTVRLPPWEAWRADLGDPSWELRCRVGIVWATPGDGRDIVLRAGQAATIAPQRYPLVVSSLGGDAVVALHALSPP